MQSAAGGTSQRLKPAFAMVCSRSRIPIPPPDTVPALLIVVIPSSPNSRPSGMSAVYDPVVLSRSQRKMRQDRDAHSRILTPGTTRYAGAGLDLRSVPLWTRMLQARIDLCTPAETPIGADAGSGVDRQKVAMFTSFTPRVQGRCAGLP